MQVEAALVKILALIHLVVLAAVVQDLIAAEPQDQQILVAVEVEVVIIGPYLVALVPVAVLAL
jgi:hypothetical protein